MGVAEQRRSHSYFTTRITLAMTRLNFLRSSVVLTLNIRARIASTLVLFSMRIHLRILEFGITAAIEMCSFRESF